jgi:hypothetical protein
MPVPATKSQALTSRRPADNSMTKAKTQTSRIFREVLPARAKQSGALREYPISAYRALTAR